MTLSLALIIKGSSFDGKPVLRVASDGEPIASCVSKGKWEGHGSISYLTEQVSLVNLTSLISDFILLQGIRQALSAFLTHDPEWLLGFQNGTRDLDQYVGVIDSYLEDHVNHVLNISHEFCKQIKKEPQLNTHFFLARLFSKCEGYMVKSCGHVVNRRVSFKRFVQN